MKDHVIVSKIKERFYGSHYPSLSTLERQTADLLINSNMLVKDQDENLILPREEKNVVLLRQMLRYIEETLDGSHEHTIGFVSALVNLVDTIHDGNGNDMTDYKMFEKDRGIAIMKFIMSHMD